MALSTKYNFNIGRSSDFPALLNTFPSLKILRTVAISLQKGSFLKKGQVTAAGPRLILTAFPKPIQLKINCYNIAIKEKSQVKSLEVTRSEGS